MLPGISAEYHGYPDRPETPDNVRKQRKLELNRRYRADLDRQTKITTHLKQIADDLEKKTELINLQQSLNAEKVEKARQQRKRHAEIEFYKSIAEKS
jgi:hypothetical protein